MLRAKKFTITLLRLHILSTNQRPQFWDLDQKEPSIWSSWPIGSLNFTRFWPLRFPQDVWQASGRRPTNPHWFCLGCLPCLLPPETLGCPACLFAMEIMIRKNYLWWPHIWLATFRRVLIPNFKWQCTVFFFTLTQIVASWLRVTL